MTSQLHVIEEANLKLHVMHKWQLLYLIYIDMYYIRDKYEDSLEYSIFVNKSYKAKCNIILHEIITYKYTIYFNYVFLEILVLHYIIVYSEKKHQLLSFHNNLQS